MHLEIEAGCTGRGAGRELGVLHVGPKLCQRGWPLAVVVATVRALIHEDIGRPCGNLLSRLLIRGEGSSVNDEVPTHIQDVIS